MRPSRPLGLLLPRPQRYVDTVILKGCNALQYPTDLACCWTEDTLCCCSLMWQCQQVLMNPFYIRTCCHLQYFSSLSSFKLIFLVSSQLIAQVMCSTTQTSEKKLLFFIHWPFLVLTCDLPSPAWRWGAWPGWPDAARWGTLAGRPWLFAAKARVRFAVRIPAWSETGLIRGCSAPKESLLFHQGGQDL